MNVYSTHVHMKIYRWILTLNITSQYDANYLQNWYEVCKYVRPLQDYQYIVKPLEPTNMYVTSTTNNSIK